jgi:DNA invertase Pin-like site-specific DNA recombinase
MTSAAVYVRISQDTLGTGLGTDRQEADCRKLAESKGWAVGRVFTDNDVSAFNRRKKRPEYEAMMVQLRAKTFDALVVYNIDRLYRQPRELEDLIDLCEDGILDFATCSGDIDLGTPGGCTMARVLTAFSNQSSKDASRRIKRKAVETAQSGLPNGGRRPYGFQADQITHNEHEADVIRDVASALIGGESLRSQCLRLNERGEMGANGRPWQSNTMKRMLLSPRLIGKREHRVTGLHDAIWNPIITEIQQIQLRATLTRRGARVGAPSRYLLTGVLRCGVCGSRMQHRPAWHRNKSVYLCPGPPRGHNCVSITASAAEEYITEAIIVHADAPLIFTEPASDGEAELLAASIATDEAELTGYGALLAGGMEPTVVQAATSIIAAHKRASEQKLAARTHATPRASELHAAAMAGGPWTYGTMFALLHEDDQRDDIAAMVERIDVVRGPRGTPVAERLRITWS